MNHWRKIYISTMIVLLVILNALLMVALYFIRDYLNQQQEQLVAQQTAVEADKQAVVLAQYLSRKDSEIAALEQTEREWLTEQLEQPTAEQSDDFQQQMSAHHISSSIEYSNLKTIRNRLESIKEEPDHEQDGSEETDPESVRLKRELELRLSEQARKMAMRAVMDSYVMEQPYRESGDYLRLYRVKRLDEGRYDYTQWYKEKKDSLQKKPVDEHILEDGEVHVVPNTVAGELACVMRSLQYQTDDGLEYRLLYIRPVNSSGGALEESWRHMEIMIRITGIIPPILMAISLYLIVQMLFRPVSELTRATREFARGDRSQKLDPVGWGEVAELASLFNAMADETQRLEAVEEDAGRKQRFLDSFTHELRTPLTNIHGYSELMKRVQLTEEDRLRYLDYMMHESRRLNRLSEALFNLTVLRENTTQMDPVSCAALLDAAGQSLRAKAEDKGVSLVCEESDCTLFGNAALLESLCTNLAENAIRACAEGDEVRLRFRNDGGDVVLQVTDTGMGIAPDQLTHITEPFYRVDKARSRSEGGVGLGLYLCSEIVRVHGAHMSFDSREGEGTTVTVRFPVPKSN